MEDEQFIDVKDRLAERLLELPGVHAVGIGSKVTANEPTGEPAVTVFVERKRPLDEIPQEERIPLEVEGIKTDVVEMPVPTILAPVPGKPFGVTREDSREYRPVRGGTQIAKESATGVGTLGCLCTVQGDANTIIALTNHHVLFGPCSEAADHRRVGQPDGVSSCSDCCDDIIGGVHDAQCDSDVDLALVKLSGGMKWLAEVEGIGLVAGQHNITAAEGASGTFQVKKRGRRSGLTGGTVAAIGVTGSVNNHDGTLHRTFTNGITIVPNPDPASAGTPTDFSLPGDSGSAILSETDQVVGVLFAGSSATATSSGSGTGFPIQAVIDKFATGVAASRRLTLQIATATTPGDVRTVPTAMVADTDEAVAPPAVLVPAARAAELEEELRSTPRGEWYAELFDRHRDELAALVRTNRRVTVVWHKSGAAELFQLLVRAFRTPGGRAPAQVRGRPIRDCIDELAAALRRAGSAPLATDLEAALPTLPDVGGLTEREIIGALRGPGPKPAAAPA